MSPILKLNNIYNNHAGRPNEILQYFIPKLLHYMYIHVELLNRLILYANYASNLNISFHVIS